MYSPRFVLMKVLKRYLTEKEFSDFSADLMSTKRLTNPHFMVTLKRHFDIERWKNAPLIWQDIWLYNYFAFEYKGSLKCKGLMRKYTHSVFIEDDAEFFNNIERLNKKKAPLPKGVTFIPDKEKPSVANHLHSTHLYPRGGRPGKE